VSPIETVLDALRAGRMVVVVDDEGRENEGDLVMAAQAARPEHVNFMVTHGRGLVCCPLTQERAGKLGLSPMTARNTEFFRTAFTVSVDARTGTTTGISAADRAVTARRLADPEAAPADFVQPGHLFPIEARPGGVLERAGHTEAAVDLLTLAGLTPVALICEIMNPDGTMARRPDLERFARAHDLPLTTIADLARYRRQHEVWVRRVAEAELPSRYGTFRAVAFQDVTNDEVHLALVKGTVPRPDGPTLVRLHSECLTGDVLGSLRCDCGDQLHDALRRIEADGQGVLLYLRQEGRGIGLGPKIQAYALQEQGRDTVEANLELGYPADARDYGIAAQMLRHLGVSRVALMTNNPDKVRALAGLGIDVEDRIPLEEAPASDFGERYLETKRDKLGHFLRLRAGAGGAAPKEASQ
jgi:3,4-dihydroxy 2-butanone 4-phosphate synthase/GTP cyclohydrolase II